MIMRKRILTITGVLFLAGLTWGVIYLDSLLPIITGYSAKYLCSAVFISNRMTADVEATDLRFSFIKYVKNEVNYKDKSVISRFLWGRSKSIYRDGFGSTLLCKVTEVDLRKNKFPLTQQAGYNQDTIAWPLGNIIDDKNTGIDKEALNIIGQKLIQWQCFWIYGDSQRYSGHRKIQAGFQFQNAISKLVNGKKFHQCIGRNYGQGWKAEYLRTSRYK
jgi:hypothetical protein